MGFWSDFKTFLRKYEVLSLAVAFVLGRAVDDMVTSLVSDVIMPLINPLLGFTTIDAWQDYVLQLGPFAIKLGSFIASLIDFAIISLVIFFFVRALSKSIREEES